MFLKALLSAALVLNAQGGPRVSAQLSSNSVSVGETFTFAVVVENADGDVDIPTPRLPAGIDIVGTQDYTESQFSIPGGRKEIRRREFALLASQPGRFRIPSLVISIGRRRFSTNALDVAVTGSAQPKSVTSSGDVWLRASMNPETVYVGQQSTLTIEAGFSDEVRSRLTGPPSFETPSPNGFFVQDVPGGPNAALRSTNGRVIEVQSFQRAYFPLSAGRYSFAPARAIIDIREGFLFAPETREIRSNSPKLTVLPLPTAGQPKDFRGAVGNYSIRAFAQPDTVAVGEAAQVMIEISGTGNIKAVPQPVLPTVAGVEEFTPTEDADVAFDGAIQRGTKHFQWVVIPQRTGTITIPPIAYSFFDPASRSYKTVKSEQITIHATATPSAGQNDAAATLSDVRTQPKHTFSPSRVLTFTLLLLPLLAVLFTYVLQKHRQAPQRAETAAEALAQLRSQSLDYPAFLRELEKIVRRCAGSSPPPDAQRLLERIAQQRFAPAAAESAERDELLRQAEALCR